MEDQAFFKMCSIWVYVYIFVVCIIVKEIVYILSIWSYIKAFMSMK